jgi:hypothetical protein
MRKPEYFCRNCGGSRVQFIALPAVKGDSDVYAPWCDDCGSSVNVYDAAEPVEDRARRILADNIRSLERSADDHENTAARLRRTVDEIRTAASIRDWKFLAAYLAPETIENLKQIHDLDLLLENEIFGV